MIIANFHETLNAMDKLSEILPVEISASVLNSETLTSLIEDFILREGTDYGAVEASYDSKILQIRLQIERGDVKIVFDPSSETVTLVTKSEYGKRCSGSANQL